MSLLSTAFSAVIMLIKSIGKKKISEIALDLITTLPKAIMDAIDYGKLTNVQMLDEALDELDLRTGVDAGAFDIMHDLPADKEEQLFDAMSKCIEIIGKNKLKVAGYYVGE